MHSLMLIGMCLIFVLSLAIHINGLPVESEASQIFTMTDDQKMEKPDTTKTVNIEQKTKLNPHHHGMKRRRGHRRVLFDCRTTEMPTTKPTKIYIQMPNLFISQSWGPNR